MHALRGTFAKVPWKDKKGDRSVLHRQNLNQLFSLELFRVSSHRGHWWGGFPLSNAISQRVSVPYLFESEREKSAAGSIGP